jgi:hypothetical protein
MTRTFRHRPGAACVLACLLTLASAAMLQAQRQFELFVAAIDDASGQPARDLTARDLLVTERSGEARVARVERYSLPIRLTILVDNGSGLLDPRAVFTTPPEAPGFGQLPLRADGVPDEVRGVQEALVHYRRGLQALIEILPGDMEVEVIALSPNPRWLSRATTNQVQLRRSVQLLTPEDHFPSRFADALVEYAKRLDRDFRGEQAGERPPYAPVLVVLGSTGLDGSEPRRDDLRDMLTSLATYGVRTHFAMLTRHGGPLAVNAGSQVFVAKAVQELTGGEYVPLAVPLRATTLLPEWGRHIADRHRASTSQYRVTVERPAGATGPIADLGIFIRREGYSGIVTADGRVP